MKLKLRSGALSDVGQKRHHNEDCVFTNEYLGLFAVADGMGGHAAGEVASGAAIATLSEFVAQAHGDINITWPLPIREEFSRSENVLHTAVALANQQVCSLAGENAAFGGMGTTVAAIYFTGDRAHICHVGDSRVYLMREGVLECLTQDHSWVNEQVQRHIISEEEARNHRWRNVITRALGNRQDVEIDLKSYQVKPGDSLLICSDGLTTMLADEDIAEALADSDSEPQAICERLVKMANEAGGLDNVSVVIVRVDSESE
jgi:serine/threonine protein phosphatase PrpC